MAVEIKELVIRAVIDYKDEKNGSADTSAQNTKLDQATIVQSCVRQVLQILNRSNQR